MADLTITVPDVQVPRILAALEESGWTGGATATAQDARAFIIDKLVQFVKASEQRVAAETAVDAVTEITPT